MLAFVPCHTCMPSWPVRVCLRVSFSHDGNAGDLVTVIRGLEHVSVSNGKKLSEPLGHHAHNTMPANGRGTF